MSILVGDGYYINNTGVYKLYNNNIIAVYNNTHLSYDDISKLVLLYICIFNVQSNNIYNGKHSIINIEKQILFNIRLYIDNVLPMNTINEFCAEWCKFLTTIYFIIHGSVIDIQRYSTIDDNGNITDSSFDYEPDFDDFMNIYKVVFSDLSLFTSVERDVQHLQSNIESLQASSNSISSHNLSHCYNISQCLGDICDILRIERTEIEFEDELEQEHN